MVTNHMFRSVAALVVLVAVALGRPVAARTDDCHLSTGGHADGALTWSALVECAVPTAAIMVTATIEKDNREFGRSTSVCTLLAECDAVGQIPTPEPGCYLVKGFALVPGQVERLSDFDTSSVCA